MANIYIILLSLVHTCIGSCSTSYGAKPCVTYVPAPPGHVPHCARPGLTYCEHPYDYPAHVIQSLLDKWKYDHSTLFINESKDEYNSYYQQVEYSTQAYPGYMYSYPYDISTANGRKFNNSNNYAPYPPARNISNYSFGGQLDDKKYSTKAFPYGFPKFSDNVFHYPNAPGLHLRDQFSGNLQNNWFKRYGNREIKKMRLMRKRRSILYQEYKRNKRQDLVRTETLCQTRATYVMPRAGVNNQGNWMYIVNMPDQSNTNAKQLVRSEICTSQECSGLCSLPLGYTSRCEQKYIQKRLVALGTNGQDLYTDLFWIPSCCLCTLTSGNL